MGINSDKKDDVVARHYQRSGPLCAICGRTLMTLKRYRRVRDGLRRYNEAKQSGRAMPKVTIPDDFPTIDHITEKWRGGTDAIRNLQITCPPCNNERSNAPGNDAHQLHNPRARGRMAQWKIDRVATRRRTPRSAGLTQSLESVWPKEVSVSDPLDYTFLVERLRGENGSAFAVTHTGELAEAIEELLAALVEIRDGCCGECLSWEIADSVIGAGSVSGDPP